MKVIGNSHKNRPYKPLVSDCMKVFLRFFQELEKILGSKQYWLLYSLSPQIELFGDSVSRVIHKGEDTGDVDFCVTEQKVKWMWKGILKIPPYKFVIKRNEIQWIFKTINLLKEMKLQEKKLNEILLSGEITQNEYELLQKKDANHFLFIGEHRLINSYISNADSISGDYIDNSIGSTRLSSIFFQESALRAIREGVDMIETEEGLCIRSQLSFFYTIVPLTSFASRIDRSYKGSPLKDAMVVNGMMRKIKFDVPSIFNGNFDSLTQLVWSLFIQYYLSAGGFEAIKICNVCGSMFLEKKKGAALYCSDKCRRIIWANENNEKEDKSQCRNRQNVWLSRNTDLGQRREYKDFCEKCDLTIFPKGGKCLLFLEKYEKDVEKHKITKKGERQGHKKSVGSGTNNVQTYKMPKTS